MLKTILILLCLCINASAGIVLQSTFDANDEGWRFTNRDGSSVHVPGYVATGGSPGTGYIHYTDVNDVGYATSPASWAGNRSVAYDGSVRFWARDNLYPSSTYEDTDVILYSSVYGHIHYDFANNPTTDWGLFVAPLRETGWRVGNSDGSGAAVSQALMKNVLASLTAVRVRAEYRNGTDSDDLDTITMLAPDTQIPEPATASLFAAAALALALRRWRRQA